MRSLRWWYGGVWEPAVSDAAATCWDTHLTNSWYRVSFKQWCSVFSDLVEVAQPGHNQSACRYVYANSLCSASESNKTQFVSA